LPLLVAAILNGVSARADDTPQARLEAVQKALEESRKQQQELNQQATNLNAELARLRTQAVAAAQSAQAHEEALTRLEAESAALAQQEKEKSDELARRRSEQTKLATALLRLARNPPSGLALTEGAPVDVLRGGILLSAAVPPLIERANMLSIELKTLADLKGQIREAEARHHIESDSLAKEESRIRDLIQQETALQQKARQGAAASAAEAQKLAAQASDLKDLIERAEAEARRREAEAEARRQAEAAARAAKEQEEARIASAAPPPSVLRGTIPQPQATLPAPSPGDPTRPQSIRPFSQAKGRVIYPAAGSVVTGFGGEDPEGGTSRGMTIETRPGAQVVAPFDGRVVFAGPFKGYGRILIISHGDGYHSLVAGLDQINGTVGQWLIAGEPIGTMPAGEAKPRLYLELRHDGQPINPLPWLATRDAKVKG
jgi:septal ring factor EnvC (AmiA/AmiB activator)